MDRILPLRARLVALALACAAPALTPAPVRADVGGDAGDAVHEDRFAAHGQFTYTEQASNGFAASYRGPNSLSPRQNRETADATLFLGARLWPGAEAWIDAEADQGFGLDDTLGVAGFPSGEAFKVGSNQPYFRLPRAFIRETMNVGGPEEKVEDAANQFAGVRSADRWVFTVGKFGVTDVFDVNAYAHDPRGDFLNWSAIDAGTFDYAADAWGFTVGASAEWYHGPWALRGGFFDLSDVPNSPHLEPGFHEFQLVGEAERRHEWRGRPGKLLVTYYESFGRMGLLTDAIALAQAQNAPVDIASVRRFRTRAGVSASFEQALGANLGVFARAGKAGGNVEAYEFTDIDRTLELGASLKGTRWGRPDDTLAVAAMDNGISATRERYLNAGGLGVLVGDGRLPHPGAERIIESYYSAAVLPALLVTADFQRIFDPAYNRDRGPVSVVAVRVHAQF